MSPARGYCTVSSHDVPLMSIQPDYVFRNEPRARILHGFEPVLRNTRFPQSGPTETNASDQHLQTQAVVRQPISKRTRVSLPSDEANHGDRLFMISAGPISKLFAWGGGTRRGTRYFNTGCACFPWSRQSTNSSRSRFPNG